MMQPLNVLNFFVLVCHLQASTEAGSGFPFDIFVQFSLLTKGQKEQLTLILFTLVTLLHYRKFDIHDHLWASLGNLG